MNEILVLYILNKSQTTMYGLCKYITQNYGSITRSSYGTIQPILKKLEQKKYIFSSKFYTDGGKPYFYYSVTPDGLEYLKEKLIKNTTKNPVQLLPMIRIKLSCADVLDKGEQSQMLKTLKTNLIKLKSETEESENPTFTSNFYHRIVRENSICEYKNLINLIEGLENASNS